MLSRLDYCNAILVGLPQTTLSPLQRVLHAAARMVLNLRPRDHVTPALRELHRLPIAERVDFKLCLLVHKALVGQAPHYIADLIRPLADLHAKTVARPIAWAFQKRWIVWCYRHLCHVRGRTSTIGVRIL